MTNIMTNVVSFVVPTAAAPNGECIPARYDWLTAISPLTDWFIGNMKGAAPVIATAAILIAAVMLFFAFRSHRAAGIVKWIMIIFAALLIIAFGPTIILQLNGTFGSC